MKIKLNFDRVMSIVAFALLCLVIVYVATMGKAFAADATVTWTMPTTNTDGSAIPASGSGAITSTRIEYGTCSGSAFGTSAGNVTVNAPATTATITGFAAGSTACFRAFVRNTFGNESGPSGVVAKTFPTPTPNPPTLSATITVAYELNGIRGDGTILLGRAVGQIELGAPCMDYEYRTNKGVYHGIERKHVRLVREPKSPALVTQCEWT